MKTNKLLILTVMTIIFVGCSNKGNGDKFYVEYNKDNYPTIHSTLDCNAIRGGVRNCLPGEVSNNDVLMCAKCMDDDLYKIATEGKKTDDDDDGF
jgi:hypothetical protein